MATIIPPTNPSSISHSSERTVARALLDALPDNVKVYHSYPWLRGNERPGGPLREGEADFVIVDPRFGILILEAKGGNIEYDSHSRVYRRRIGRDYEPIKDPFEQARRNMHVLRGEIAKKLVGSERSRFTFAYAAVFPDCDPSGEAPPGAEPAIVLGARDLPVIDKKIEGIFRRFGAPHSTSPLPRSLLQAFQLGLSPIFRLLPVLYRIREQEQAIFRMTEEQAHMLDLLSEHDRAEIRGVAGSGKTRLAMATAQRFAEQGKSVLFLCFNRMLADWLKDELPERYKEYITISGYQELCKAWGKRAGLEWNDALTSAVTKLGTDLAIQQDRYWNEEAPETLVRAADRLPERFDVIIVDEGQDFRPNWWTSIELLQREPGKGPFYLFQDPGQALRLPEAEKASYPSLGTPYPLNVNCRNTAEIASYCARIRNVQIKVRASAPAGNPPTWIHAPTKQDQIQKCSAQVKEWMSAGKLKCSQIVLMCMGQSSSAANSSLGGLSALAGHPLIGTMPASPAEQSAATRSQLDAWRKGEGILVTTIRRFRGLESDAVIIFDLPAFAPEDLDTRYMRDCEQPTVPDFYVALSRAKHLATVIGFVPQPKGFAK